MHSSDILAMTVATSKQDKIHNASCATALSIFQSKARLVYCQTIVNYIIVNNKQYTRLVNSIDESQ
jgi:hypothetical protein